MPFGIAIQYYGCFLGDQAFEARQQMQADDDGMGQMQFARSGCRYVEALIRSRRDTKLALTLHMLEGWTPEQHRYWVNSGERP